MRTIDWNAERIAESEFDGAGHFEGDIEALAKSWSAPLPRRVKVVAAAMLELFVVVDGVEIWMRSWDGAEKKTVMVLARKNRKEEARTAFFSMCGSIGHEVKACSYAIDDYFHPRWRWPIHAAWAEFDFDELAKRCQQTVACWDAPGMGPLRYFHFPLPSGRYAGVEGFEYNPGCVAISLEYFGGAFHEEDLLAVTEYLQVDSGKIFKNESQLVWLN